MAKVIETVAEHCKHPDCSYRKNLGGSLPHCDYIGATGKRRGCKISKCDKYTTERIIYPSDDWIHLREEQGK